MLAMLIAIIAHIANDVNIVGSICGGPNYNPS